MNAAKGGFKQQQMVSSFLVNAVLIIICLIWIIPADVAGSWRLHAGAKGAPRTIELEQTYQRVNGTAQVGGRTLPLSDVRLVGDRLSFASGNAGELRFEGTVDGDKVSGMFTDRSGTRRQWSAERPKRRARKELAPQ